MTFYFSISVYICDIILLSISSLKMNACSWRKAADLVAQGTQANHQVQAAAMAESNQLESLPLNALSADDSGPLQVTYGTEQPFTTSTPRATSTSIPETQTTDTYCQIISGMSEHLYLTLIADGSLSTPVADNCSTCKVLLPVSLVVHKCIAWHWGMLRECTLGSYRVLRSISINITKILEIGYICVVMVVGC